MREIEILKLLSHSYLIKGIINPHAQPEQGEVIDVGVHSIHSIHFIPTVVYMTVVSSLSDYSPQHSPHSYFHVIFIYPAVRVEFYAYVNICLAEMN